MNIKRKAAIYTITTFILIIVVFLFKYDFSENEIVSNSSNVSFSDIDLDIFESDGLYVLNTSDLYVVNVESECEFFGNEKSLIYFNCSNYKKSNFVGNITVLENDFKRIHSFKLNMDEEELVEEVVFQKTSDIWVTAYFASWNHYVEDGGSWGVMPSSEIDWDAFTHMAYFAVNANSDGTLGGTGEWENMNDARVSDIVPEAHSHDTPIVFTVGGAGNEEFQDAITPGNRDVFVSELVGFMTEYGFDGIDLDMEPIRNADVENYKAFVEQLHKELENLNVDEDYNEEKPIVEEPLLIAAVNGQPEMFAELQEYFDQINIMTYDYSGPWEGWVTWHNSPIYNGGHTFYSTGEEIPSLEKSIDIWKDTGVDKEILGAGVDFYGYEWSGGRLYDEDTSGYLDKGISEPLQRWHKDHPPERTWSEIPYSEIADEYGLKAYENEGNPYYNWDEVAKVPYISVTSESPDDYLFISYDDERTAKEKVKFARNQDIGGLIIWELSGGYRSEEPIGERQLLLSAVKEEFEKGRNDCTMC